MLNLEVDRIGRTGLVAGDLCPVVGGHRGGAVSHHKSLGRFDKNQGLLKVSVAGTEGRDPGRRAGQHRDLAIRLDAQPQWIPIADRRRKKYIVFNDDRLRCFRIFADAHKIGRNILGTRVAVFDN